MLHPEFYFENSTFDFVTLTGDINPGIGQQLQELTRPGVDGVAYRRIGRRGVPFQLKSTRDVATIVDAYNLVHFYKELQGEIIDMRDEREVEWFNVVVLRCEVKRPRFVSGMAGGLSSSTSGYLVEVTWLLQMSEFEWIQKSALP